MDSEHLRESCIGAITCMHFGWEHYHHTCILIQIYGNSNQFLLILHYHIVKHNISLHYVNNVPPASITLLVSRQLKNNQLSVTTKHLGGTENIQKNRIPEK